MIPITTALKIVSREAKFLNAERISLTDAVDRILAEDITADSDLPPFDRSQMDGYAVKASDTLNAPVTLKLIGESAAGHGWHKILKSGQAVRIMTGARIPVGADAVQKIEVATEDDEFVTLNESTEAGRFIVAKGKEIKKGKAVLRAGEAITAKNVSVPAAFGYAKVKVGRRPRVAILSTGSEIVEINKTPGRDQIRNSNSIMLGSLSEENGATATVFPIIGDDLSDLKSQISKAAKNSDILVTTGGVSVGKYDLTKLALKELEAEIFFEKLRLKPGKPTVFAKLKKTLVFALPGNPVSAAVTYYLFVRKAILAMQGASATDLKRGSAIVSRSVKAPKERDAYLPAAISTNPDGTLVAEPLTWHGSSDFIGFAGADALIAIERGKILEANTPLRILFL